MITAGLVVTLNAFSQADVTSAFNANKQGDFAKAAEYIEKALNDPKAVAKEKTWRYRGDIYLNIVGTPELEAQFPNAFQLCIESYSKSIELDTKKDYEIEINTGLSKLRVIALESAFQQYEANDFCKAASNFSKSKEVSIKLGLVDTISIYNGAFCAMKCGLLEQALAGFQESAKIGYSVPEVYGPIVKLQLDLGKKAEALKTISDARQVYPKDEGLLTEEVNIYLADSNYTKAIEILKALTIEDPKNEMIWVVLASTNEKLGRTADQEAAYLKALEINPNYFDALFNLGATYYNQGINKTRECGNIDFREKVKFADCEKAASEFYSKAVTQLELAYKASPSDRDVINALKLAYTSAGNFEGQKKMEEALKKL